MERLERGTYIGGQQIAAIVGQHPYMSAGQVYAHSVTGQTEDISDVGVIRRGLICERGFIDHIVSQLKPKYWDNDVFVIDPDVPFFAGTQDLVEMDEDGAIVHIHELTVTSSRMIDKWGNDGDPNGPMRYKWIQCQWYIGITGAKAGTIWLFVADTGEIRSYPVERSEDSITKLRDLGEEFWLDHVMKKVPPDGKDLAGVAGWKNVADSMDAIYPTNNGTEIEATPELVTAAMDYEDARLREKDAQDDKRAAQARLKNEMKEADKAAWKYGSVTWKSTKGRQSTDWEAAMTSLLKDGEVSQKAYDDAIAQFTVEKPGPRVMRVTIKKESK